VRRAVLVRMSPDPAPMLSVDAPWFVGSRRRNPAGTGEGGRSDTVGSRQRTLIPGHARELA
jgi:hypothetical protein